MKKLLFGVILLAMAIMVPVPTMAGLNISLGIALPPPVVFEGPPDVIALPDTDDVYVVPGIDVDIFFWDGWWWRPWEGRWYRSRYYNRGWAYFDRVPNFYFDVDPGWRGYYRNRDWYGHRWNYERIPYRGLKRNWSKWHESRHWERRGNWGIQGYQPRLQQQREELRHQRQEQYQQRPEVQRHQQWKQERQRQPQVQPSGRERRMQGGPEGRGERRQVEPMDKGRPNMRQDGPMGRGERQQVRPAEKGRPEGGPAPKDIKRHEGPQKDQERQRNEQPER